ncbi:MAG: S8 family serine peptidase [Gemmatimonadota bacterium]
MTTITIDAPALRGRSGRGVSVAVIDSGVNPDHPHVGEIAGGVAFTTDGEVHDDVVDRLGHGTAVIAAIQEKAPDADIHVLKVFDDALATSVPTLVKAIDWASERHIWLVNLSLGTPNSARAAQLAAAVERARSRGTIIVSAREHEGIPWLPGSLPGVLGILLEEDCPRDAVRVLADASEQSSGGVVLLASGYPRPIPGVPPERNLNGISFAVANATGMVARAAEGTDRLTVGGVARLLDTAAGSGPRRES